MARNPSTIYPWFALICIVFVICAAIAMIILSLIPTFVNNNTRTYTCSNASNDQLEFSIAVPADSPLGSLTDAEILQLTSDLQTLQSTAIRSLGTITVVSGNVATNNQVSSGRKRRQEIEKVLTIRLLCCGRSRVSTKYLQNFAKKLFRESLAVIISFIRTILQLRSSYTNTIRSTTVSEITTISSELLSSTTNAANSIISRIQGAASSSQWHTYRD